MLYGSLTMGSCYLIASISLKYAESDPSRKQLVRPLILHSERELD